MHYYHNVISNKSMIVLNNNNILHACIIIYFLIAGTITANMDSALCPGEQLILNCVGQGTSQRWLIYHVGISSPYEYSFTKEMAIGTQYTRYPNPYTFTLIAQEYNHFESSFSTIAMQSLNNARVVCNDNQPASEFVIRITGMHACKLVSEVL